MGRSTFFLMLLILVGGCGQLSNEDLVFLAAVPNAKEIELIVEEPLQEMNAQALIGEPAQYYIHARDAAHFLNTAVAELLTFVEALGQGYPPTQRTDSSRIWGPVQNVDNTGLTLRLEIRRNESVQDSSATFTYCLHLGSDVAFSKGPITCEDTLVAGLQRILWGTYEPRGASEGARSGMGNMNFDFDALRALGGGEGDEQGLFAINYDFTAGGESKHIQINWRTTPTAGEPLVVSYDYSRNLEGKVLFYWQLTLDVLTEEELGEPFSDALELLTINAQWIEGQDGSADVLVEGGDLGPSATAQIRECWDNRQLQTYARYEVSFPEPQVFTIGDAERCPTTEVP
ncbi:MAG: hypothetical protein R3C68_08910 [Myxococcota bacterium]